MNKVVPGVAKAMSHIVQMANDTPLPKRILQITGCDSVDDLNGYVKVHINQDIMETERLQTKIEEILLNEIELQQEKQRTVQRRSRKQQQQADHEDEDMLMTEPQDIDLEDWII